MGGFRWVENGWVDFSQMDFICHRISLGVEPKAISLLSKLGLFGTVKLVLALQFIVTNTYFSVACNTKVSVRATLK